MTTQSLILSSVGLDRVTLWAQERDNRLRIVCVLNGLRHDSYVVLVDCSERDSSLLSLMEH